MSRGVTDWSLRIWSIAVYFFLYAPIAVLVVFSLNNAEQTATWGGFTLKWYRELWDNEAIRSAAKNSLGIAVFTTIFSTALGTAAALGLRDASKRVRRISEPLLVLPIVLPDIIIGVALLRLFSAMKLELGFWTICLAHLVFCTSYVVVLVRARLSGLDRSLEEAAADLGATPWATFWLVTLPQIAPAVLAGGLLVLTLSLDDYLVTSFVAGVGDTTLPIQIYSMIRKKITPEINAICTVLMAITTAVIALSWLLERRSAALRDSR